MHQGGCSRRVGGWWFRSVLARSVMISVYIGGDNLKLRVLFFISRIGSGPLRYLAGLSFNLRRPVCSDD